MKWYRFKATVLMLLLAFSAGMVKAESNHEVVESKYDKRINNYRNTWARLIPTHTKLQYAGDMGLLSVGLGWDYGKKGQWETDLFLGFLPKYSTEDNKFTFTIKQSYVPWSIYLGKGFSIEPLTCGLYLNTVFNDDFWTSEPDRYPSGYYNFSSKMRIHVFLGEYLTYNITDYKRNRIKALSLFYELSTCDLYLASAVGNSYLGPKDYLRLSFGVKMQLF